MASKMAVTDFVNSRIHAQKDLTRFQIIVKQHRSHKEIFSAIWNYLLPRRMLTAPSHFSLQILRRRGSETASSSSSEEVQDIYYRFWRVLIPVSTTGWGLLNGSVTGWRRDDAARRIFNTVGWRQCRSASCRSRDSRGPGRSSCSSSNQVRNLSRSDTKVSITSSPPSQWERSAVKWNFNEKIVGSAIISLDGRIALHHRSTTTKSQRSTCSSTPTKPGPLPQPQQHVLHARDDHEADPGTGPANEHANHNV